MQFSTIYPNNSHDVYLSILIIAVMFIYILIYPNNSRDVYLYIYWVSAYMG